MEIEIYKAGTSEVALNNNMLTLTIHGELENETEDTGVFDQSNIITGRTIEKTSRKTSPVAESVDYGTDIQQILKGEFKTKTARIRALYIAGASRQDIKNLMGVPDQQISGALIKWKEYEKHKH